MQVLIQPSSLSGSLTAPASKSAMQRACAAALVRAGETILHNPGISNDDKAAIKVIEALGAKVETLENGSLKITSDGVHAISNEVNNGESGLGIRMFAPLVAMNDKEITVNGEGSLLSRPMNFFDRIFPMLGVDITSKNGRLPLKIKGPLQPENITIDGSLSSQFLTGLLFAFSACDAKDVTIKVNDLKSKPYIDLTLQVMEKFQLKVPENDHYNAFYFWPESANYQSAFNEFTVEGDWSGGAFLLVAGAVAGDVIVKGLNIASTQADRAVLTALRDSGCNLLIRSEEIQVKKAPLKAFRFDATDCPDLFPPLAALAACCEGTTEIKGVQRLAHKESNRALTLQHELGKMNIQIELDEDLMKIHGGAVTGAQVHSRHDHRIAMACAVAALKATGETVIHEAHAVAKSYPHFYEDIKHLGADCKKI